MTEQRKEKIISLLQKHLSDKINDELSDYSCFDCFFEGNELTEEEINFVYNLNVDIKLKE